MRFSIIICLLSFLSYLQVASQDLDISYYIPDISYDKSITTPLEFLGHEVGEMHVTHDKLYYYMKQLSEESERITLTEYARSHEKRPLIYLTVTSTSNHARIDEIKAEHKRLTNTAVSQDVNIRDMPIIIYQGMSIHGNEPSGGNGALALAYYLAAGQGEKIDRLLDEVVILLDPVYNPDGFNRFASWVNSHKGKHLISDPNSREYTEAWPRGRTNHYWFDLNRDWLLLTHPESQGRIRVFHEWKPDILTDHHEMGTNSTFFFQPGIPSRTNPNTPQLNQDLTAKIGEYHGRALDAIGSLYYTKESFDDYYYGKGSTYPDAQGCIGILFEQASSRGHLQESDNGMLTFPFTIRNQVATMLSTQDAAVGLREEILDYKRKSFTDARRLATSNPIKGYRFGDAHDPAKVARFIEILLSHQINIYESDDQTYVVPLAQDQYRLAKSIFEKVTNFQDSLFYDVSAWTMPLAFDIPYEELRGAVSLGDQVTEVPSLSGQLYGDESAYAYLIDWSKYYAPRALKSLLAAGVNVKLAHEKFSMDIDGSDVEFARGTLIIPCGNNQTLSRPELYKMMGQLAKHNHLDIIGVSTGLVTSGVNLGSRSLGTIDDPQAIILIGQGTNGYDAGEIWHHLDQNLEMAVPMVDIAQFGRLDLSKYRTIIMPDGSYGALTRHKKALSDWVSGGGNIIAIKRAINWLKGQDILGINPTKDENMSDSKKSMKSFASANETSGAKFTGGMIAQIDVDLTHPLFYGYRRATLPVFKRGNEYYEPLGDPYSTPGRYSEDPVLSGYIHAENQAKMPGAGSVFSQDKGRGKIIGLVDNPTFRGYFWGNSKLLANAIFLGHAY